MGPLHVEEHSMEVQKTGTYVYRALVRAGATGARAPAKFWQRVQGNRPDKGEILQYSKKMLQH